MPSRLNIRASQFLDEATARAFMLTVYRPFSLDIESDQIGLMKTCRELGVAIVAYSPIGRGMLGGKIRSPKDFEEGDFRTFAPRFSEENFPKNLKLVDTLAELGKKKNATATQLTLAWLMAQGNDDAPVIPVCSSHLGLLICTMGANAIDRFPEPRTSSVSRRIWHQRRSSSARRRNKRSATQLRLLKSMAPVTPRHFLVRCTAIHRH